MKRLLSLFIGLFAMMGVAATPTVAYAYPPEPPTSTVSDGTIAEDGSVRFSGTAGPFEVITITVRYANGSSGPTRTVTADEFGAWSVNLVLAASGAATLTATGVSGTVTQSVLVVSDTTGSLAVTGPSGGTLSGLVLSGASALLLGAVLVFVAVRWRRRTTGDLA